jgi:enoyl-CoA hydratase
LPLCKAKELMFSGKPISATEAERLGLINKVVEADKLMEEVLALAESIAQKSPLVLKLLKRTLVDGDEMPLRAALRHEQAMISLVLDTQDAHEGCSAFVEKRPAKFQGA